MWRWFIWPIFLFLLRLLILVYLRVHPEAVFAGFDGLAALGYVMMGVLLYVLIFWHFIFLLLVYLVLRDTMYRASNLLIICSILLSFFILYFISLVALIVHFYPLISVGFFLVSHGL